MSCVCKRQWLLHRPTLVIRSINLNTYDFKRLNSLIILSIYNEEVDNLDMKSIVNNLIKNGDVKLENVPMWGIKDCQMSSSDHFVNIILYIFKVQYPRYISLRVQWTVHNMGCII